MNPVVNLKIIFTFSLFESIVATTHEADFEAIVNLASLDLGIIIYSWMNQRPL